MFDANQLSVLSEMGIPVWQLRQAGIVKEEVRTPDTDNHVEIDTASLLARVNASNWLFCHDGKESQECQRLLQSICSAMGISQGICLLSLNDLKAIASETIASSEKKRLILFGESIVKRVFGPASTVESLRDEPQQALQSNLTTFVSSSLQSLLENTANKKQVWQDIRQIKQLDS